MNTAVTIPWEAVVNGCPPSQAKALPLVVSEHYRRRTQFWPEGPMFDRTLSELSQLGSDAVAMISRSRVAARLEVVLPEVHGIVHLTSDGETKVILQDATHTRTFVPAVMRQYVARYARFDADNPGFFVPPARSDQPERECPQFLHAPSWGFERTARGYRWRDRSHPSWSSLSEPVSSYVVRPRCEDPFAEPLPERGDPFDCIPALRRSLAFVRHLRERTHTWATLSLCYDLAIALGRCRLLGVRVDEQDDRTLTVAGFRLVSADLLLRMRGAVKRLHEPDKNSGAFRVNNHALELLETRMDAHAAYLALDEAYAAALYDGSPEAPAMSRRLTQVRRLINLFDGNLQKNLPLLRLAASTYLLDNWRRLLAPAHRDCPPWWLDGCIG